MDKNLNTTIEQGPKVARTIISGLRESEPQRSVSIVLPGNNEFPSVLTLKDSEFAQIGLTIEDQEYILNTEYGFAADLVNNWMYIPELNCELKAVNLGLNNIAILSRRSFTNTPLDTDRVAA